MTVFVLTLNENAEGGRVRGVFASVEGAQAAALAEVQESGLRLHWQPLTFDREVTEGGVVLRADHPEVGCDYFMIQPLAVQG